MWNEKKKKNIFYSKFIAHRHCYGGSSTLIFMHLLWVYVMQTMWFWMQKANERMKNKMRWLHLRPQFQNDQYIRFGRARFGQWRTGAADEAITFFFRKLYSIFFVFGCCYCCVGVKLSFDFLLFIYLKRFHGFVYSKLIEETSELIHLIITFQFRHSFSIPHHTP